MFTLRKYLPNKLKIPLWGDRLKWGFKINTNDSCWKEWNLTYSKFYLENQRKGVGSIVNDGGYSVISNIDFKRKTIFELGAGDIRHFKYWNTNPDKYILADVSSDMMNIAEQKLQKNKIPNEALLLERKEKIPLEDNSVDVIISFYSLEHLYPIQDYLTELHRILKPGGEFIGAIPTEGGLAWGLGRMFTSRRWFLKNTNIDPDKIICWEHPNYCDFIIHELDNYFKKVKIEWWPLLLPLVDTNLIIKFHYKK